MIPFLAVSLQGPRDAPPLAIVTERPGNVFLAGETVRVVVRGAAGGRLVLRLTDFDGRAVPAPTPDASGMASLGRLATGWYELQATEGGRSATAPLVVVARPRRTRTARIAVDAAHSWLIPPERFGEGAELLRMAGIPWARERLSWPEVEPQRGVFRWGKYDASADAASKRGIRVYQIFHATPAWARADGLGNRYPDDLRDVYRFCKAAAEHFRGRVQAWEVWNEADIPVFSPDGPDEHAAFMKAAYLGFKAGDPRVQVTQVSLAMASPRFHEGLYRNGTQTCFDIFNWHIYDRPAAYAARARGHFEIMDRHAVPRVPIWLTEAGIALKAVDSTLTPADKRRQAEFIPKSIALSLAAGTDRHFFFVFPHYLENGIEFGLLDADLKPYPGYAALATAVSLFGEARYLGRLPAAGDVEARLFDNGQGETLVAWSEQGGTLAVPAAREPLRVANCVGMPVAAPTGEHSVLRLGPAPFYVRAPKGTFAGAVDDRVRRSAAPRPVRHAGRDLVVRVRPLDAPYDKKAECYRPAPGRPVRLQVEVCNLGPVPLEGEVRLSAPQECRLEPAAHTATFGPMERRVFESVLVAPPGFTGELRAQAFPLPGRSWGAGLPQSTPAVLDFSNAP